MPIVRISETYDLSTKVGKMGIVGIHTPRGSLCDRLWPGLILQYKKFRFVECDVAMACASMLPADPLQVGVEAGSIAPQDMFNPILYRAVSNDAMSNILGYLESRAFDQSGAIANPDVSQGSVVDLNNSDFKDTNQGDVDQFNMYYGLLANPDGFRKAMPQAGLEMRGLYPLVYQVVSNYGTNANPGYVSGDAKNVPQEKNINASGGITVPSNKDSDNGGITAWELRGPPMRMPAIDTTAFVSPSNVDNRIVPSSNTALVNSNIGQVPPCYVGLIILPPAKLNQLYYRLKVTWTIEFSGLRAMTEINNWAYLSYAGDTAYGTDYAEQAETMTNLDSMVDTSDTTLEKIMEGV